MSYDARYRQYAEIYSQMKYWFARIMLDMTRAEALAFKSNLHPEEYNDIRRAAYRRRYWRLRDRGLNSYEARAKLDGVTAAIIKTRSNRANKRAAARWGGWLKPGTAAYNRWLMSR